jgi:hypothetical protein
MAAISMRAYIKNLARYALPVTGTQDVPAVLDNDKA